MSLALFEHGAQRLDEIVRPGMLCAFDFDGTLSPIVTQPEQACLPPEVSQRLVELSSHAPLAIITGRSLIDIRTRLRFEPDFLVGNHGLEGISSGESDAMRYMETCASWKHALSAALSDAAHFDAGVQIEDKQFSLSVHFRAAQDRLHTEQQLLKLFAAMEPRPRVVAGKCVFNLLPQDAADKGSALERLMQISGAPSAIYLGDDVTDEDVFRLQRHDLLSVRIEPAADSAAAFFLHDRIDVVRLLDELISRLRKLHSKNALHQGSPRHG